MSFKESQRENFFDVRLYCVTFTINRGSGRGVPRIDGALHVQELHACCNGGVVCNRTILDEVVQHMIGGF